MQMFAAGIAEGLLTSNEIGDFYQNVNEYNKLSKKKNSLIFLMIWKEGENLTQINNFFEKISTKLIPYLESKQKENNSTFFTLKLFLSQLKGIYVGANLFSKKISFSQLHTINADGQLGELFWISKLNFDTNQSYRYKLNKKANRKKIFDENNLFAEFNTTDLNEVYLKLMGRSRCTAIIKLLKGKNGKIKDILFSHSTWSSFSEILRIYKQYK
jgi:hypothetical protein